MIDLYIRKLELVQLLIEHYSDVVQRLFHA